jgi:hypothetical protein
MDELENFSTSEKRPVLVTKEEKMYIREGKLGAALQKFKRPAYMKGSRKDDV